MNRRSLLKALVVPLVAPLTAKKKTPPPVELLLGKRWVATIKRGLVPDKRYYAYTDSKYLGKAIHLEQPTLPVHRKVTLFEYERTSKEGVWHERMSGRFEA